METTINELELKPFYLDKYISDKKGYEINKRNEVFTVNDQMKFEQICEDVKDHFNKEWVKDQGNKGEHSALLLERQKEAIIGVTKQVNYFKDKINEYIKLNMCEDIWYPEESYENLTDAIFHENWGLAGIAKWKTLTECSSAKIIGDRIYFLIDGKPKLQEKTISTERFFQLKKALLLKTPKIRMDAPYAEVYMESGERITIFSKERVKEGQASIVFRKYVVKNFSFDEWVTRHSIPEELKPLLISMVKIGYNVAFVGAVRTGKTTFLTTYQAYEDPELEGVMIETDPEIPIHRIMPTAPIMQIIADGDELIDIKKELMRSDADYLIMAEARDAFALDLAVETANKGTMRCKLCYHIKFVEDFCYDVANKIITQFGGNLDYHIVKVAKSYQYIFEFVQLSDKSQKRLKGIHEVRYDKSTYEISFHAICKYDFDKDSWTFKNDIGDDKKLIAYESERNAFDIFSSELSKLEKLYPMVGDNVTIPVYGQGYRRR
jgi:pilus assembly protein CpaF